MARVLIAIDGSDCAYEAAARALELLGTAHEVTIAQVVHPLVPVATVAGAGMMPAMGYELPPESIRSQVRDAEATITATARRLGIQATARVVTGDPGTELCRLAAEGNVDVVVVGSHGSGLVKRVLLGSVSDHVLRHAPCPVLVVRSGRDGEHS